jgi:ABC-type Mn2+/Zn2+ transport system permease subunit
MFDDLALPFVQHGLIEVAALSVAAGLIGTWIVLRGLAFYGHAVGTAAFPGLVLADGLGFGAALGAFGTALVVAGLVAWLARREPDREDALTALVLVAALAVGIVLASDVFHSGSNVDSLLFGSLLTIDTGDVVLAGVASVVVLAVTLVLGPRWLATGFERGLAEADRTAGVTDLVLLLLVALVAVAALAAVGALLATAILVVPAATTRLLCRRVRVWQVATVALTLVEGVGGMWLAVEANAPPGPAIAVLAGGVFAVVAVTVAWRAARRPAVVVAPEPA